MPDLASVEERLVIPMRALAFAHGLAQERVFGLALLHVRGDGLEVETRQQFAVQRRLDLGARRLAGKVVQLIGIGPQVEQLSWITVDVDILVRPPGGP